MVSQQIVYLTELTVPCKDSVEEAYERKKLAYAELGAEAEWKGSKVRVHPVEVGRKSFIARSTVSLLGEMGVRNRVRREEKVF